jgi:hypothetical protein
MKNSITIRLKKKDGTLKYRLGAEEDLYNAFVSNLPEGSYVEMFISADEDNGSLSQLAKLHANIKEISNNTGQSVDDIKLEIKRRTGLLFVNKNSFYEKSFGDCSKTELSKAIQETIQLGETLGISLY